MADPYKFSFDVAAFLEEQEVADTSVAPKEGVMKKPEAPVEEAPMSNTDRLKKRFADTVSSFYSGTQEIRDKYNKAQETNPLLGRDAAQSEWMKALSTPAVTTTALGPDMDTMAMQDAQEQVAMRSASGITESLGRPAPAGLGNAPAQPETPVIYEAAATVTNGADSVVDRTAPAGLMTRPVQETVSEVDTDTAANTVSTNFATIKKGNTSTDVVSTAALKDGFDSLTLAEGTKIHLDGRGFVTLPHGIVPDANSVKKSDGTVFNPTGSHGLTASGLSGVDYSGATKYGIKRSDYTADKDWAKAVYSEFGVRTAKKYGTGFDSLSDKAKQAAYDMTWNAGIGAASWSSVKTMLKEASKAKDEDKTTANLIGFTTNFKSGTGYPRGLLKRRVQTYNLVAKQGDEASKITTSSIVTNGKRTGTKYDVKRSDGTVLKSWTKPDNNEKLGDLAVN